MQPHGFKGWQNFIDIDLKKTLSTMWLHRKMQLVHPPECGHTCNTLRVENHYKSLTNFVSCPSAEFNWYRSELTLSTLWPHHKMHFVHPPGCGHTLYSLRIKNHYESLANFMSCFIANFHWSRSKGTQKNHVAAWQDALCTSPRMWAHSVQFENKPLL
jgi:hypothetical protein